MSQSSQFYRLQKIDLQRDHNQKRIGEIIQTLDSDKSIQNAETLLHNAKQNLHKERHRLKAIEEKTKEIVIKIQLSEQQLYSGKIRNPKELQDIQNEIASLKRRLSKNEDQQLEAMLLTEEAENQLSAAEKNLSKIKGEFINKSASLQGEKNRLNKENERLQKEREATTPSIPPESIELYNKLRTRKNGRAVAKIEDDACGACGASLPPKDIQAARSPRQICFCPSCGRILYAG